MGMLPGPDEPAKRPMPRERSGRVARDSHIRLRSRTRRRARFHGFAAAALFTAATLGSTPAALGAPRTSRPAEVPLVKQLLRNNCETAALSMLLTAREVRVSQLELQRRLPRSGPLDPIVQPGNPLPVWGDPDRGFVGRVAGGGPAGGFGVYQGPIRRLAATYGVRLDDLSRQPPAELYRRLAAGHPVMTWVGLTEGPYRRWRTPAGKTISANFGEHTIVLTGVRGDQVELNDPLTGTRESWSRALFERRWQLLGRRALGL